MKVDMAEIRKILFIDKPRTVEGIKVVKKSEVKPRPSRHLFLREREATQ